MRLPGVKRLCVYGFLSTVKSMESVQCRRI